MAHFAQLNEDDVVVFVTPLDNKFLLDSTGSEQESNGIDYLKNQFGSNTKWVQTSYHHNFRGVYAGLGFQYNRETDRFEAPKPRQFPSWVWDEGRKVWRPPVSRPGLSPEQYDQGFMPQWDEETISWKIIQGPPTF